MNFFDCKNQKKCKLFDPQTVYNKVFMLNLSSLSLKIKNNQLKILDQTKLPFEEKWVICDTLEEMIQAIKLLKVRGAPLIGVSAACFLTTYINNENINNKNFTNEQIIEIANKLKSSRPTAVNLMNAIDQMIETLITKGKNSLLEKAKEIFLQDVELCQKMADHGEKVIKNNDNILTHCNTGALATVGIGTALGVIKKAHDNKKNIHVYVDETRPLLQGARLTTWELKKYNINYTLICDNMAASLMKTGKISKVFVGADRIATNGDFANKIGTYSLAVNCKFHNVPFYVVAPTTTIDFKCSNGNKIKIEQRPNEEIRGYVHPDNKIMWAEDNESTYNPAFDITPNELVTAWILDSGIIYPKKNKKNIFNN